MTNISKRLNKLTKKVDEMKKQGWGGDNPQNTKDSGSGRPGNKLLEERVMAQVESRLTDQDETLALYITDQLKQFEGLLSSGHLNHLNRTRSNSQELDSFSHQKAFIADVFKKEVKQGKLVFRKDKHRIASYGKGFSNMLQLLNKPKLEK